jgi:hypothetical protein
MSGECILNMCVSPSLFSRKSYVCFSLIDIGILFGERWHIYVKIVGFLKEFYIFYGIFV